MARPLAQFETSKGTTHPLVVLLGKSTLTHSEIADKLGVRPQTLHCWIKRAREDNRFKLPRPRAAQLARVFRVQLQTLYWGE